MAKRADATKQASTNEREDHSALDTTKVRDGLVIPALVGLASLVALFFAGLFTNVRESHPFLVGFYWIANILAALCGAVIASYLTGFLSVDIRRKLGKGGFIAVRGTGAFAVFVLILLSNPKNKMFDLADQIFSSMLDECRQATQLAGNANANARELCSRFVEEYPSRPEPYRYLARWYHANMGILPSTDVYGNQQAATLYQRALQLYGIEMEAPANLKTQFMSADQRKMPEILEVAAAYFTARGDYVLSSFSKEAIDSAQLQLLFNRQIIQMTIVMDIALKRNLDPHLAGKFLDVAAKIHLYTYFIAGSEQTSLEEAVALYDRALGFHPFFSWLLYYHRFIARLHMNRITDEELAVDLMRLIRELPYYRNQTRAAWDLASFDSFLRGIINNNRTELYRVSNPFGSRNYGGARLIIFLDNHPDLEVALRRVVTSS